MDRTDGPPERMNNPSYEYKAWIVLGLLEEKFWLGLELEKVW
jgi:hypothetical protein